MDLIFGAYDPSSIVPKLFLSRNSLDIISNLEQSGVDISCTYEGPDMIWKSKKNIGRWKAQWILHNSSKLATLCL